MVAEKCGGKTDQIINISPEGDVILVVGEEKVQLRVHSQCLRSASTSFSIMFGPVWSEGQSLSEQSPTKVPLVEDDADAMWTICNIVHHRNDQVPLHLSPEDILQIAIAVDKYDLKTALKYASIEWLKPQVNATRVDMGLLLAATLLFNDADAFIAHTLTLILHCSGSYMDLLDDENSSQAIPSRIFYLLEERRTRFRAELCHLLIKGKRASCKCGWGSSRSEKYGLLLAKYNPIQMLEMPIAEIITQMEEASTTEMKEREYCFALSSRGVAYYHEPETLLGKLDTMKKKASICIDCVQSIRCVDE